MAYNGHKNWQQWNVSLWINNDYGLYMMARDLVRSALTKSDAAYRMKQELEQAGITTTPDGAKYSVTAIRNAMVEM